MNLNFETPEGLWPYFSKHLPKPSSLIEGHEDPTRIPQRIEDLEHVSDAFEENYRELLVELRQTITTISTYHACRVISEPSYKDNGIRKLRKEEVIKWMKDFFGLQDGIDSSVASLEKKLSVYGAWNGSGVFTMCSISDSEKKKSRLQGRL